jgi:cell wall-associated NlpC family hydrolase
VLKPGETLSSIARKYGVSVKDILSANSITDATNVRDGKELTIPSAPKPVLLPKSTHEPRTINADRVRVRMAPHGEARPIAYFDKGVQVTLTARKEGWAQIELPDGKTGWISEALLNGKGGAKPTQVASAPAKSPPKKTDTVAKHTEEPKHKAVKVSRVAKANKPTKAVKHETQVARKQTPTKQKAVARIQHNDWSKSGRRYATTSRHTGRNYVAEASAPKVSGDLMNEALSYRGTPYRYGGSSRGGFDCSGFTSYLYNKRGASLPHTASGQFQRGKHVSKGDMKPGDLVFFQTVTKGISHVGVYLGNGKFVHSSSRRSGGVRVDSLDSGYYNNRFRGARRVR